MVQACRHIKPNGERCNSPALRGHCFCYFHSRVHSRTRFRKSEKFKLPVPEDFAAIQESIAKVFDGIVDGIVDLKESAQILWGLQIAMQTIPRKPVMPTNSVEFVTLSDKGDELAPPLEISTPMVEALGPPKALPPGASFDLAASPVQSTGIKTGRVEIPDSLDAGKLLAGGEKVTRYLDRPSGTE